jgi:hypothetical protein
MRNTEDFNARRDSIERQAGSLAQRGVNRCSPADCSITPEIKPQRYREAPGADRNML